MRTSRILGAIALAMLATQVAFAADKPQVSDVALRDGGILVGQVVDKNGAPQANAEVLVVQNGKAVAVDRTDKNGQFSAKGLRGGVYHIATKNANGIYRAWAPRTAPPVAKQGVTLISGEMVLRGQGVTETYGPAIRGAIAGGLLTGGTYWALDHNPTGS